MLMRKTFLRNRRDVIQRKIHEDVCKDYTIVDRRVRVFMHLDALVLLDIYRRNGHG